LAESKDGIQLGTKKDVMAVRKSPQIPQDYEK